MEQIGIKYGPRDPGNLFKWDVHLTFKDPNSPYFGQKYDIEVKIPKNYPFEHPVAHFISRTFHPNIDANTGKICLNLINDENCEWTAANTIYELAIGL